MTLCMDCDRSPTKKFKLIIYQVFYEWVIFIFFQQLMGLHRIKIKYIQMAKCIAWGV